MDKKQIKKIARKVISETKVINGYDFIREEIAKEMIKWSTKELVDFYNRHKIGNKKVKYLEEDSIEVKN